MEPRRLRSVPDAIAHWPWRLIALVAIAALGYLVWRGYQQPELIFDFANLRLC
jgi:hypothetical protein